MLGQVHQYTATRYLTTTASLIHVNSNPDRYQQISSYGPGAENVPLQQPILPHFRECGRRKVVSRKTGDRAHRLKYLDSAFQGLFTKQRTECIPSLFVVGSMCLFYKPLDNCGVLHRMFEVRNWDTDHMLLRLMFSGSTIVRHLLCQFWWLSPRFCRKICA